MGAHIDANGQFQSDKYPTCPPGKVPMSVKDPTAQDLLWIYAQRRRGVDAEFSSDLETCLVKAGFEGDVPPIPMRLICPGCGMLHVDAGAFATKPHHTHACQGCGMVWRPAVLHTVGVAFLPGFKDGTP
jgi:hypothetical protein